MSTHYSQAIETAANEFCPIDFCDIYDLCNSKQLEAYINYIPINSNLDICQVQYCIY